MGQWYAEEEAECGREAQGGWDRCGEARRKGGNRGRAHREAGPEVIGRAPDCLYSILLQVVVLPCGGCGSGGRPR